MNAGSLDEIRLAPDAYTIPDGLTPVARVRGGYTAQKAFALRNAYDAPEFVIGRDPGLYLNTHLGEGLGTAMVYRDGPVRAFERAPIPEIDQTISTTALGRMSLREAFDDTRARIQAYAVVHKGQLVFEEYIGMRAHEAHIWNSSAKVLTGVLIHMLWSEGRLDLEAPVPVYLPFLSGTDWDAVTVAHLYHHHAGMDFVETEQTIANRNHPVGRGFAGAITGRGAPKGEAIRDILPDVKAWCAPGTRFE